MVRFLKTKYDNVKIVFISHHTEAKEVTEEQFFTRANREDGRVVCFIAWRSTSSTGRFPAKDWNIYHFISRMRHYYSDNDEPSARR